MEKPDWSFWQVILVIIAIIFAVLAIIFGYNHLLQTVSVPTSTEISIIYPLNSSQVYMQETITGTAKNIPEGDVIWIIVDPHNGKYYPQSDKVKIQSGEWSTPVGIGTKETVGNFDIIVVLADQKAQDEFNNYFETCYQTNSWAGMDKIPNSAKVYDKITVTRNSVETGPEIKIAYPLNSATVQMKETITGTAENIPDGQQLWIVIYPQDAYKYYLQNPVDFQSDGRWTLPVQFGEEQNVGTKFDLYAVLADNNAEKELNNYMTASENAKSYGGMRELPNGTTKITKLTVIRA